MDGSRRLAPHLPLVWRAEDEVQIGASPALGVRLAGLGPADRRALSLLERGASLAALETDARRSGADPQRGRDLAAVLAERRMLVPTDAGAETAARVRLRAERWAWLADRSGRRGAATGRRPSRSVLVTGGTPLLAPVAAGFAASGVGSVAVSAAGDVTPVDAVAGGPALADVGRRLGDAVTEAVARAGGPAGSPGRAPDLVVLVGRDAHDAASASRWLGEDRAHLSVLVRDSEVVVGPLVVPGEGACLHCVDLHHRDRDRRWPDLLRQLLRAPAARPVATVPALVQVAAGVAVLLGLAHLDGAAEARPGVAATLSLPLGAAAWRVWPPHEACGCTGLDASRPAATESGDVPAGGPGPGGTMPR